METRSAKGFEYITGTWPLDSTKATIVFIHGSGGTSRFWESQVEACAEHVNTVALDLPGHGRSETPGFNRVKAYAAAVMEFIGAIEAPNPIPCGFSFGGAIGLQLLLDYSQRFQTGILIGTGARLKVLPAFFDQIKNDYVGFVDTICKYAASDKSAPEIIQPFREDLEACRPAVTYADYIVCDGFDVIERLGEILVPVLVITAEDDKLTPSKYGDFLEKHIQNATRVHIMGAGHIVPLEKPEEVNIAILEFLNRI